MNIAIAKNLGFYFEFESFTPGFSSLAGGIESKRFTDCAYPKFSESFEACNEMERHFEEDEWNQYLGFIGSNSKHPALVTALRRASSLELTEAACRVWFPEMFE